LAWQATTAIMHYRAMFGLLLNLLDMLCSDRRHVHRILRSYFAYYHRSPHCYERLAA